MDSGEKTRRAWKWCSLIASVAFLTAVRGARDEVCRDDHYRERFLVLVSTMDGRLTALDGSSGDETWSINTGSRPLLSSSITNLEINRDGIKIRLIPSLDGGLYQYDGSGIEPVPLAADLLLSNSFRFSHDSTVVGGKEVESYGVDLQSGLLKYVCSASGCQYFSSNTSDESAEATDSDTLVITRHTKTVRAVEMQTGNEKWNFSVSQHEVSYVKCEASKCPIQRTGRDHQLEGNNDEYLDYEEKGEEESHNGQTTSYAMADLHFKVIVPSGLVTAVLRKNPEQILWQQQFRHAVANAWLLIGDRLTEIDLFNDVHVPALSVQPTDMITSYSGDGDDDDDDDDEYQPSDSDDDHHHAVLYVGVYDNQIYVQPSYRLQQQVHDATTRAVMAGDPSTIRMPHVHWKPYLATAASRTPFLSQQDNRGMSRVIGDTSTALVPHQVDYPFDEGAGEGVYLLQEHRPIRLGVDRQIADKSTNVDMSDDGYVVQLVKFWKEFLAFSVLTVFLSVFVHLALFRSQVTSKSEERDNSSQESVKSRTASSSQSKDSQSTSGSSSGQVDYVSRYYSDFEQLAVLGHGGFGVVFEARNKLDDCLYAIKRIALNDSDHAREKVMREVKALAKLDHVGIVRYHQSWFESPPAGWQEERDKVCIEMPSSTPGFAASSSTDVASGDSCEPSAGTPVPRLSQLYLRGDGHAPSVKLDACNPFKPFFLETLHSVKRQEGQKEQSYKVAFVGDNQRRAGSSGGFEPKLLTSDSDNFPIKASNSLLDSERKQTNADSFQILLPSDSSLDSGCTESVDDSVPELPFHAYMIDSSSGKSSDLRSESDSFDVIFADSGNGGGSGGSSGAAVSNRDCSQAVIDISTTSSQSVTKDGTCPSQSETGLHQNCASTEFSSTHATRPKDLPLKNQESLCCDRTTCKLYLYIQMQLCKRESLKDWLAANTQDRARALVLDIFHQIVSAVDYVHDKGLMHRDLKPSNIFFSMDGIVKIGDFGLVTALEQTVPTPYDDQVTPYQKHTSHVGTRLYMSPEQHAGRRYTHKVDIYALGLIFFELFYPFNTQMERIRTLSDVKRLRFPDKFVQKLSKDEVAFVRRLLSHDPEQRPSCKDILNQPMLEPFEEVRKAYEQARACSSSRIHTLSTSSSHSGSGSSSQ